MGERRFDTGETPHVVLSLCAGDVSVASWRRQAIEVSGAAFRAENSELDVVQVWAETAVSLKVPLHCRLTIGRVDGALTIKGVAGLAGIGQVQGDLTLSTVGSVQVERIGGALRGEGLDGPLAVTDAAQTVTLRNTQDVTIQQAGGSISIRYANGDVILGQVAGALEAHTLSGNLQVDTVGGPARLDNLGGPLLLRDAQDVVHLVGSLAQGEHQVSGQSDIFLYWPGKAPLYLVAEASQIYNGLKLRRKTETAISPTLTALSGIIENHKTELRLATPARIGLLSWDGRGEPALADGNALFAPPPAPPNEPPAVEPPAGGSSPGLPATPPATPAAFSPAALEAAIARGVGEVLASIELEFGPEWKYRFAALNLAERLQAAVLAELARRDAESEKPGAGSAEREAGGGVPDSGLSVSMAVAEGDSGQPITPGQKAFHKAETAVVRSLEQAEESMDKTRSRLAQAEVQTEPGE